MSYVKKYASEPFRSFYTKDLCKKCPYSMPGLIFMHNLSQMLINLEKKGRKGRREGGKKGGCSSLISGDQDNKF